MDGEYPDWIELHNPTADPVDLLGWFLSDDPDDPMQHRIDASLVVPAGGFILLYADGEPDRGPAHLSFGLSSEGEAVVLQDPWGNTSIVRYGELFEDGAVARAEDCCDGDCWTFPLGGTPGQSNTSEGEPPVEALLVPRAAEWRWHTSLEGPGPDWATPEYDDAAWSVGPAPLGFGDAHIVTALPEGDDLARYRAAWFRTTFDLDDADAAIAIVGSLLRDDGAVLWVNGEEVYRNRMPDGPVGADTFALLAVSGADETRYVPWAASNGALRTGLNVLAVEIHQANPSGGDLGFDLELSVLRSP
ncbi:MAG: hypothetical protein ACI8PZ_007378 [Myxococcota bacterium]